jgi:hypothetical protein
MNMLEFEKPRRNNQSKNEKVCKIQTVEPNELWVNRHHPRNISELAMNSVKVKFLKDWILSSFQKLNDRSEIDFLIAS